MRKIKRRLSKKQIMERAEAENQLLLEMGVPACPKCKHALSAGFGMNGKDYLLCPFCGETVEDSEGN